MAQILENYDELIHVSYEGVIDNQENNSEYNNCYNYSIESINNFINKSEKLNSLLISPLAIQKRVMALAKEIANNFKTKHIDICFVLTGAFIFASDLSRALYYTSNINSTIHCIKTSVYDKTIKGTNEHYRAVTLELEPKNLEKKDVLLIEDIADQGFTLNWLTNHLLNELGANSLKVCSLLYKNLDNPTVEVQKLRNRLKIDFIGFTIPDVWVAGYGIDAAYEFRNLPYIVSVNENYYKNN